MSWHSNNEMVNLRDVIETLCYMVDEDSDGVEEVLQLPTIDLVRCKECKWAKANGTYQWCGRLDSTARITAEDFCSYGERKSEPQTEYPKCAINETPLDECGFCEHFNCDTCKCEAQDEPHHSGEATEMVESQSEAEITIEMALNDCKTKHNGCENCGTECMWRDKSQTDDGTAFIKRHGLRVDYGDEVPYDLKPFIDW